MVSTIKKSGTLPNRRHPWNERNQGRCHRITSPSIKDTKGNKNKDQIVAGIREIKDNENKFKEKLDDFSKNFVSNGAEITAKMVNDELDTKT